MTGIWAVVPVKELEGAKQRLSSVLSPEERRVLATTMLEDVLDAVSAVHELAGVLVVTVDPAATSLATRYGARIVTDSARVRAETGWRPERSLAATLSDIHKWLVDNRTTVGPIFTAGN